MQTRRGIALIAALSGLLAVILAAAGSHILAENGAGVQKLWATALQMHMFHTIALLGIAALIQPGSPRLMSWSGVLMMLGVLLFSGSLYLRAGGFIAVPGLVTPLGGLLLMAGWLVLIMTLIRKNRPWQP
jgi:uncharacterized membrane protein YgdD (TMEM256/DUF423 family)